MIQRMGRLLLALSWLPFIFFARPQSAKAVHAQEWTFVARVSATHFPSDSTQLHQFRTSGLSWWVSKITGLHSIEACPQTLPDMSGVARVWRLTPAPDELLKTWHFRHRTALYPRDPCLG